MTVNIIVENMKNAFDYYKKGLDHGKLEKYQEAIENFNKAIELDPNSVAFYFARGDVYEILKKYEEAINDYDKAIKLEPNNSYFYYIPLQNYKHYF